MGRYAPTDKSHMPEVVRLLTGWGATAEPVHLGDELIELARIRVDYDLYVLKDKSDLAMRVAAALHPAGAALLNPYPASATLRHRIVKLRVLQLAGPHPPRETGPAVHAGPRAGGHHPTLRRGAGDRSLRRHRGAKRRQVVRGRHDEHSRLQRRARRPPPPRGIHLRRDGAGAERG